MFKLFFLYPIIAFIVFWVSSDVDINASLYAFDENHISIEFPKQSLRSSDPWFSFYWNADSAKDGLNQLKDSVIN